MSLTSSLIPNPSKIDFATPTISRVIDIGGLMVKEPKALDGYWNSVMNKRSKVVLISFGSMAKSYLFAPSSKEAILRVISLRLHSFGSMKKRMNLLSKLHRKSIISCWPNVCLRMIY
ncbi:hypothetical protein PMAYCL1PPCAC_19445 [Pristionchus mayeri]|uniref:glucuronosyltransferase n=1 Tax=Pristionchus mayeri TaxID=1317129 RepID=A0AAN5CRJ0_9BILA|nr:hypothetical protein PMAYCL1PPCAC_19445 [Pristionchus mayeri]